MNLKKPSQNLEFVLGTQIRSPCLKRLKIRAKKNTKTVFVLIFIGSCSLPVLNNPLISKRWKTFTGSILHFIGVIFLGKVDLFHFLKKQTGTPGTLSSISFLLKLMLKCAHGMEVDDRGYELFGSIYFTLEENLIN